MQTMNFYMDDSGTRRPDRAPTPCDPSSPNFFALGGILVNSEQEEEIRRAHATLCQRWSIAYPLHSVDIRHAKGNFTWLKRDGDEYTRFMRDLNHFVTSAKVRCLACVIDRPGHDSRYRPKYGRRQWHLCRTAFYIAVERAAKAAMREGRKLRVMPERTNPGDERRIRDYYASMKTDGCLFDTPSPKYAPMNAGDFGAVLHELRFKDKNSPMAQLADLVLWPLAISRYRHNRAYDEFRKHRLLLDDWLPAHECEERGTKYSCFGLVDGKATA
jgi:hypothetical protein